MSENSNNKYRLDITKMKRASVKRRHLENAGSGLSLDYEETTGNFLPVIVEEVTVGPLEIRFKIKFVYFFDRIDILVCDTVVFESGMRGSVIALDRRSDGVTVVLLGFEWCSEDAKTVEIFAPETLEENSSL